jgi:hypothetical protein
VRGIVDACGDSSAPAPSMAAPRPTWTRPPWGVNGLPEIPGLGVESEVSACAGGGSTVTGRSNDVKIRDLPSASIRMPASSHSTILYALPPWRATRSRPDSFKATPTDESYIATWSWLTVPMGGSGSLLFKCLDVPLADAHLLTSTDITLTGSPLGLSNGIVDVVAWGTTCTVPC